MKSLKIQIVNYQSFKEEIHKIRFEVFVKEQNVPIEEEIDNLDEISVHFLLYIDEKPVGTGRLIINDGHIGRIAILKNYRDKHLGSQLMLFILEIAKEHKLKRVWLASQLYAKNFYKKLGFKEYGNIFLDAGIKHINMEKFL